jgi:phage baseplate assembly protein V
MTYPTAETDRMSSGMAIAGTIEAVDYPNARVRVRSGDWVSAWLPWQSVAAGRVRHWRPPSVNEQVVIVSLSGQPEQGFVMPGYYTDQHQQANDNREEITATDWPDTAREHYDHDRHDYRHYLPPEGHIQVTVGGNTKLDIWKGKVVVNVEGSTVLTLLPGTAILKTGFFLVDAGLTEFTGVVQIDKLLHVSADTIVDGNVIIGGNDIAGGAQIDGGGNTNHHVHGTGGFAAGSLKKETIPPFPIRVPVIPEPTPPTGTP